MSTVDILGTLLLRFMSFEELIGCEVGFVSLSFLISFNFETIDDCLAVWVVSTGLSAVLNFLFCWPFDELLDRLEVELIRLRLTLMESFEDECCSFEIESGELLSELLGELRLDDNEEDEDDAIEEPLLKSDVFIVGKKLIESHKSSN